VYRVKRVTNLQEKKKKVTGKIGCVSSRKEETVEQFLHQQIPEKFFKL